MTTEVEGDGQLLDPKNGKTKRRAKVWGYFWIIKTDGRVTHTVCKLCGPNTTPAAYCGNTSNMRSHLTHVHQDAFCQLVLAEKKAEGVSVEGSNSGHDTPDTGTIEAMLPQVSTEKRDVLHKKFALWIVRRRRCVPYNFGTRSFVNFVCLCSRCVCNMHSFVLRESITSNRIFVCLLFIRKL